MNIETARGIAARIWCDQDFQNMEMDVDLAEEIAQKLMAYANEWHPQNDRTKKGE